MTMPDIQLPLVSETERAMQRLKREHETLLRKNATILATTKDRLERVSDLLGQAAKVSHG